MTETCGKVIQDGANAFPQQSMFQSLSRASIIIARVVREHLQP